MQWIEVDKDEKERAEDNSNVKPDDMLLANAPLYGTTAAGCGLYFRVRTLLIENGLIENSVIPAVY